jgi:hypothetical protein
MTLHVRLLSKSLIADCAGKWSFTRMNAHVFGQVASQCESLEADSALERMGTNMCFAMHAKRRGIQQFLVAQITRIQSLARMLLIQMQL